MKTIYCSIFGHEFEVSKKITYHVKEYKCTRCNAQMTTNGKGHLIPLTPKYKEINSVLERIHNKRVSKRLQPVHQETLETVLQPEISINFTPHFS